jgi:hypothetical protein
MISLFNGNEINAQTEWTGPITTFIKANNADWTLEVNQDRITSNVWITRANNQSVFNIADNTDTTSGDCSFSSPFDTEWAFGTIADGVNTLTFGTFLGSNFADCAPPSSVINQNAVLHLITDDIYIDIKFLSWSSGDSGGGISYERSTDQTLSTNEFELENNIKLFPNPSSELIQISGLKENENYRIYNISGSEIKNGIVSNNEQIDIRNFSNGLYFLKFDNGNTIKFIKK